MSNDLSTIQGILGLAEHERARAQHAAILNAGAVYAGPSYPFYLGGVEGSGLGNIIDYKPPSANDLAVQLMDHLDELSPTAVATLHAALGDILDKNPAAMSIRKLLGALPGTTRAPAPAVTPAAAPRAAMDASVGRAISTVRRAPGLRTEF